MKEICERASAVCRENLARLSKPQKSVSDRREAHIRELARTLCREIAFTGTQEGWEKFRREYSQMASEAGLSREERVYLCRFIPGELGLPGRFDICKKLLSVQQKKRKCRISYVRSPLSDMAYSRFALQFEHAKVSYEPDFASALEDVFRSGADYAILPCGSVTDGRMKSFWTMAEKYELHAVLACSVHSAADETTTFFLLLSKNTQLFFENRGKPVRFDFTLCDTSRSLPEVLYAARIFGISCAGVYTDTLTYDSDAACAVSLDITEGDIDALAVYLMLEHPRHIPLGIYNII